MFKFDYKDECEMKGPRDGVPPWDKLSVGPATFKVLRWSDTDKFGNPLLSADKRPKIQLILLITDKTGFSATLFESWTAANAFRMLALLKAIGRRDLYDPQGIDIDQIVDYEGDCTLIDNDKPFGGKIKIKEFMEKEQQAIPDTAARKYEGQKIVEDFFNDEIPF